jgi:hypothetical protein
VVALLLAVAVLVLPLWGLAALGRTASQGSPLNHLAFRSAKRLRSPGMLAPRLTTSEYGVDGGRKRSAASIADCQPHTPISSFPQSLLVASLLGRQLAAFPLRC